MEVVGDTDNVSVSRRHLKSDLTDAPENCTDCHVHFVDGHVNAPNVIRNASEALPVHNREVLDSELGQATVGSPKNWVVGVRSVHHPTVGNVFVVDKLV
jgi:hypothetical protein